LVRGLLRVLLSKKTHRCDQNDCSSAMMSIERIRRNGLRVARVSVEEKS
jgi:hypothetical protein